MLLQRPSLCPLRVGSSGTGERSPLQGCLRVWDDGREPPLPWLFYRRALLCVLDLQVVRCPQGRFWLYAQMRRSKTGVRAQGADRVPGVGSDRSLGCRWPPAGWWEGASAAKPRPDCMKKVLQLIPRSFIPSSRTKL